VRRVESPLRVGSDPSTALDWRAAFGHERALLDGWYRAGQLLSWAKLLKRVFALDLEQCPNSGGKQ
jgi:hypothetical protein